MPLRRFLVKTAITVVTPPVVDHSFPPIRHTITAVEPPQNRQSTFFAIARRLYCGGTAVMEVLLRSLYGVTAVMTLSRRSHCGLAQPAVALRTFEHVQNFRRATANVRGFDSCPRCYGDQ